MSTIIHQSEIMSWTREDIEKVPEISGIYTLRSSTTVESILYIGATGPVKLKEKLIEHFLQGKMSEIRYFDWYQTNSDEDARVLQQSWIIKYHPQFND